MVQREALQIHLYLLVGPIRLQELSRIRNGLAACVIDKWEGQFLPVFDGVPFLVTDYTGRRRG